MKRFGLVISIVLGLLISFVGVRFSPLTIQDEVTSDVYERSEGDERTLRIQPRYALLRSEYHSLILGLLFYATMLAGIALGQLFQEVVAKPDEQVKLKKLLRTLNKGRSWAAMLASPIVFFSTVPSLLALGAVSVAFFYALQNGFFCLAVFNAISAKFTSSSNVATGT